MQNDIYNSMSIQDLKVIKDRVERLISLKECLEKEAVQIESNKVDDFLQELQLSYSAAEEKFQADEKIRKSRELEKEQKAADAILEQEVLRCRQQCKHAAQNRYNNTVVYNINKLNVLKIQNLLKSEGLKAIIKSRYLDYEDPSETPIYDLEISWKKD